MKNSLCYYRNCLLLILVIISSGVSAQDYLLRERSTVEKKFKEYGSKNKVATFIYKTDSALRLSVQDSTKRSLDIVCVFNIRGICYKEVKISDCNECFQKYLAEALSNKMYKWKKVNELLYISSKFWNRCIVLEEKKPFSFSIIYNYLGKRKQEELYKSISQ